jgi:hypothetical protein
MFRCGAVQEMDDLSEAQTSWRSHDVGEAHTSSGLCPDDSSIFNQFTFTNPIDHFNSSALDWINKQFPTGRKILQKTNRELVVMLV